MRHAQAFLCLLFMIRTSQCGCPHAAEAGRALQVWFGTLLFSSGQARACIRRQGDFTAAQPVNCCLSAAALAASACLAAWLAGCPTTTPQHVCLQPWSEDGDLWFTMHVLPCAACVPWRGFLSGCKELRAWSNLAWLCLLQPRRSALGCNNAQNPRCYHVPLPAHVDATSTKCCSAELRAHLHELFGGRCRL